MSRRMAFLHLPPIRWLTSFYNPPFFIFKSMVQQVTKRWIIECVKGGFELSFYGGLKMYDLGGLGIDRCQTV